MNSRESVAIYDMWDGFSCNETKSAEERLTSSLKSKLDSNKTPDRAYVYLVENWTLIKEVVSKESWINRHCTIHIILANTFGNYSKAPINMFLLRKGMLDPIIYIIVFGLLTCFFLFKLASKGLI